MYEGDSFFTLTVAGRVGLVSISSCLALLWLWAAYEMRRFPRIAAGACALALMWLFIWLSPQIYYMYYRLLFDDLPLQWVARWPEVSGFFTTLLFRGRATLSAHSLALLGWVTISIAILWPRRNAAN